MVEAKVTFDETLEQTLAERAEAVETLWKETLSLAEEKHAETLARMKAEASEAVSAGGNARGGGALKRPSARRRRARGRRRSSRRARRGGEDVSAHRRAREGERGEGRQVPSALKARRRRWTAQKANARCAEMEEAQRRGGECQTSYDAMVARMEEEKARNGGSRRRAPRRRRR